MRTTILTIAGSDSSGGAGIQADLKAIAANGGYGASVVTAVTAQNTRGVEAAETLPPSLVRSQLDAVFSDLRIAAVKTGMLGNEGVLRAVAERLRFHRPPAYVCDPVLVSKSGHALLPDSCVAPLREQLLPLATLVTPNVHEAAVLSGIAVVTLEDAEEAARRILNAGARAVLVKGGHLSGAPGTDVLATPAGVRRLPGEWIDNSNTHGTGCTLSAAIATWLGRGATLDDAVDRSKRFLTEALRWAEPVGHGVGPTQPFFFLRSEQAASDWVRALGPRGTSSADGPHPGRLHVITDEQVQSRFSHAELARRAAEGGADVVQFREKRPRTTSELIRTAEEVARALRGFPTRLVVNDRADVAAAVGAAGVHLGMEDLPPAVARRMLDGDVLVGATANSREQALQACRSGATYLGVGPVFGTTTKANPAPALGLTGLRAVIHSIDLPVIAVGAIVAEHVAEVLAAGAYGVAVTAAVACDPDPAAATRRLRHALDACGDLPVFSSVSSRARVDDAAR